MARKPRLHESGGVYHVKVRGNGGQYRPHLRDGGLYSHRDAFTLSRKIGQLDVAERGLGLS